MATSHPDHTCLSLCLGALCQRSRAERGQSRLQLSVFVQELLRTLVGVGVGEVHHLQRLGRVALRHWILVLRGARRHALEAVLRAGRRRPRGRLRAQRRKRRLTHGVATHSR
eukprot:4784019-Pleurochrysis_carterae.AAC.1